MQHSKVVVPIWLTLGPAVFLLLAIALFILVAVDAGGAPFASPLVIAILVCIVAIMAFLVFSGRHAWKRRVAQEAIVHSRERESASIFEHAPDGILILDDRSICVEANPTACALLGLAGSELVGRPFESFHLDREEFGQYWKSFLSTGYQRGQARLLGRDQKLVFVDYTATANVVPGRHIVMLCNTTQQVHVETSLQNMEQRLRQMADQGATAGKQAENQIANHLAAAEIARSEAEALRRSTLALTQNLAMDSILDALLACLADVVPYTSACVLFAETDLQLLVAREAPRRTTRNGPGILNPSDHPVLNKVLRERKSVFLADTEKHSDWHNCRAVGDASCWIGVPLIASDQVLGILSVAADTPHAFTTEHLRMAKSLAIPAAVGVQKARIHERAEIYASELELQLKTLQKTRKALEDERSGGTPRA